MDTKREISFLSQSSGVIKAVITIGLLIALFSAADYLSLLKYTKEMSVAGWLICFSLFIAQLGISTLRFWIILHHHSQELSFFRILGIQSASLLAGNLLFGNLGGAVARIGLLYRLGITWPSAVGSVLIDRVCVVVGLLIMAGVTLPFIPFSIPIFNYQISPGVMTIFLVSVGLLLLLSLTSVSSKMMVWLKNALLPFWDQVCSYLNRWDVLLIGLALSVFSQIIFFVAQYFVASEIGIQLGFWDLMTILPAIALLASLPVSLGGWGVREGAMVFGLLLFDVPFEKSLLLSVIGGVLALLAVLPAGLYCLVSQRKLLFQQAAT